MTTLALKRCERHASREAAARCPECGGYFCRECVTEHEDRVICSDCLARISAASKAKAPALRFLAKAGWGALSFFILWLAFFWTARILLSLPAQFHEGTYWTEGTLDD